MKHEERALTELAEENAKLKAKLMAAQIDHTQLRQLAVRVKNLHDAYQLLEEMARHQRTKAQRLKALLHKSEDGRIIAIWINIVLAVLLAIAVVV